MELIDSTLIESDDKDIVDDNSVGLYQKHEKVYSAAVYGTYQRIRSAIAWPLLILFFIMPWLSWNNTPLVWFDLSRQQFHVFNATFWSQELYILSYVLMIAAFGLFAVTTWAGRVWCGYSCPHTVWTDIFIIIERWIEGSRNRQIKRDHAKLTVETFFRKSMKHSLWLLVAFMTGFTFVAFFTTVEKLASFSNVISWDWFWIVFFTMMTYINAGFMREQVCKYMCPYARFQSAMLNPDTLVVTYDHQRGEPRGSQKSQELESGNKGDCINCWQCVNVCPVGIDIREGLQMECINCGLCVDACNAVMKKTQSAPNLIQYTSENETAGKIRSRWNPRFVGYFLIFFLLSSVLVYSVTMRIPLSLNVIRERGQLYHLTDFGGVQNVYILKVMNKEQQRRDYRIDVDGMNNVKFVGKTNITVDAGEIKNIAIRLESKVRTLNEVNTPIRFIIKAHDDDTVYAESESRFIAPFQQSW